MVDRRVRKTKKLLREGLGELLKSKPIKDITVREIAELTDINRGTFYLHYKDIYDMLEQIENEMFEEFNAIISAYTPEAITNNNQSLPLLADIFKYFADNSNMCAVLLSKNGDIAFVNRIKNIVKERCLHNLITIYNIKNMQNFEYFYSFIISGCIGIFETWLNNGMKENPKEMATIAERIIINGVKAFC